MDWSALATVAVGLLTTLGPAAVLSRRARLRIRLRQATELLRELPHTGHDELRAALAEVVEISSKKLARIEMAWADLQRDPRKRTLRMLVLGTGWTNLLMAAGFVLFPSQFQPIFHWPAAMYWWAAISIGLGGAAFISFAYDPRALATFSSKKQSATRKAAPEGERPAKEGSTGVEGPQSALGPAPATGPTD